MHDDTAHEIDHPSSSPIPATPARPVLASASFSNITSNTATPIVLTDKENYAPPSMGKTGPKESSYMANLVEKAKSNMKKIPAKRSLKDALMDSSRYVSILPPSTVF